MNAIIEKSIKLGVAKITKNNIKQRRLSNLLMNIINMLDVKSSFIRKNVSKYSFNDYKKISKKFKIYNKEWYFPNNYYGIANNLYKYSQYDSEVKGCIEHGSCYGNNVISKFETNNTILPAIFTFSNYRKKVIKNFSDKLTFTIGTYIHYADNFFNEDEYIYEKKKIGKNLLVFPSHSIENIHYNYDLNEFIDKINQIYHNYKFDTVTICLYWADIERGLDKIYKKNGFNIVTAGYREDPLFLCRLKTIINLSDLTISNSIGTHIGYCVYLNKPHYIIKQNVKLNCKTRKDYDLAFKNVHLESAERDKQEIYENFKELNFDISDEQMRICNKYWGINEIKSPDEIRFILEFCDFIFNEVHNKNKKIEEVISNYLNNINLSSNVKLIIESYNK